MKRIIILWLAIFTLNASAQFTPNAIRITQRLPDNSAFVNRDLIPPTSSSNGIFFYNGSTALPQYALVGANCSFSGGILNCTGIAQVNSDWNSVSGVSQISNKPTNVSAFSNDAGYLVPSDLAAYATSAAVSAGLLSKANTATTLAGYGITDAYPLSGNPSSFLTGITSGQVTTALGFTPYNATNPAGYSTGTVTSITAGTGLSGGVITTSGTISLPNTGTAGTYSGVTTDAQGRVTTGTSRSFNYTTRAVNTCFQVSATQDSAVSYAVDIVTVSSLLSGQTGTVYLRIYTNNICTTGTQEITRAVNGNTQTVGLSVTMTQTVTGKLSGVVPAGMWVQLVTENNTGTPTFTARPGQEVQM